MVYKHFPVKQVRTQLAQLGKFDNRQSGVKALIAGFFVGRIVKSSVTFYRRKLQTVSSSLRPYGVDY
ncbi:hypothetical protein, partial [Lactiplantibacillus pentosus]|uniref:hypothetical protein n=1 Tax=Lactiplantibacillus pentosus TaxID=1589 RepID=UPI001CDA59FA